MSREKNLIKNTAILSLGTFAPKFLTVFIVPILTAKLTKIEYGSYDLILTLVALFLPAITLQISSAAFRFLIDQKKNSLICKKIISTILMFTTLSSLLACIVYYVIFGFQMGYLAILICLYFISDILMIVVQQIMRGLGKNLIYSLSIIVKAVLDISLIIILLGVLGTESYGLSGVILSMVISTFASFLFCLICGKIIKLFSIRDFDLCTLKELLRYSWPMVPNNLSNWVLRVSDKVIITTFLGLEANAIYAVANKLPTIFDSLQSTFILAWQENASIAAKDKDKDEYYSYMCSNVYKLFVGLMAGLIAITPLIWHFLIKGDYGDAYYQLPLLYISMLFSSFAATIGGIYIAHMKTKSVGITTTVAAMINLVVDFLFVKDIGIYAASISTLISYFVLLAYRMYDIQRFQRIKFNYKEIILGLSMLSIMAMFNYQRTATFDFLNIILSWIIIYFFDKDIVIITLNKFSDKILRKG